MVSDLPGVAVVGPPTPADADILTAEALAFAADLVRLFDDRRRLLVARRPAVRAAILGGDPSFADDDAAIDDAAIDAAAWSVPPAPPDLDDRRVEITGPAEPKMMINALNSGARVFMADLEDALAPTWPNVVGGQAAIRAAVRRTLTHDAPDGRIYRLAERTATLVIRPRGWHLEERHLVVDGRPAGASLVDVGLWLWHSARAATETGSGPYVYLPKLENDGEARLWADVFRHAEDRLGLPAGSIRTTVLIETLPAAFRMDGILWALRDRAAGLNAGRWDYLFSTIKCLRDRADLDIPDRAQLTMTVPFMRAYTNRLVRTCHRRGAHAIGGMAAFIPSRRDPEVNARAIARVRDDKVREAGDGFDGTWVAHPDLVAIATEVFDGVLGDRPHQKDRRADEPDDPIGALTSIGVPGGQRTEAGLRANVSVALAYLDSWLRGTGAAAIDNLMEDAATAEIARSQLWLWRARGDRLDDGRVITAQLYASVRDAELHRLGGAGAGRLGDAAHLLDGLVLSDDFAEFLTLGAYDRLG